MSPSSVTARPLPTALAWLAATEALRGQDPVMMNLPGSIAESVVAGARYDDELWLVVEEAGEVVGCAVRTAPFPPVLAPMSDEAGVALGEWLALNAGDVTGLNGPGDVVAAVTRGLGMTPTVRMRNVVRVLDALASPVPCGGAGRAAVADDVSLLVEWFTRFSEEARLTVSVDEARVRAQVGDGRLWVWEDGSPVAMGGHASVVATPGGTVGRIGPVYTVPEHRQRGYGSALTHAIAVLLTSECDRVRLFADAQNPGSNRIYERLGFAAVAELVEAELT